VYVKCTISNINISIYKYYIGGISDPSVYILVAPCFKNLLRLEAGYPALRCHNLEETPPSDLK